MTDTTEMSLAAPPVKPWKLGLLAGMASYLDAGALVAVSVSLAIWQGKFGLPPLMVGVIPATITIAVAIGSFIGGQLGDRIGRKRIYSVDLLVFGVGLLLVMFAPSAAVLFLGLAIAGLAVGADVPTSLALVGEMAPPERRGRLLVFTQILWGLGPGVILLLATVFGAQLGLNLPYLLFGHLFVFGIVTWALRAGLKESTVWKEARGARDAKRASTASVARPNLWTPTVVRALVFTGAFYLLLTIYTNFLGSFASYFLVAIGKMSVPEASGWVLISIPVGIIGLLVLLPLIDGRFRRTAYRVGTVTSIVAWSLPVVTCGAIWAFIVALIISAGFGIWASEPHYKVWSQELFPTLLRGTAQGISFGFARLISAATLIVVPVLLAADFRVVLGILLGLVVAYTVIGWIF